MKKERKKTIIIDFKRYYLEERFPYSTKDIYERLEENNKFRDEIIDLLKDFTYFGEWILSLITESENSSSLISTSQNFLNLKHLAGFYIELLETFVKDISSKIVILKKSKEIKIKDMKQFLIDDLGMRKIGRLIINEASGFLTEFHDFVKNTEFDENFPKYGDLMEAKEMIEKMEREIKSHLNKVFEFKI